MHSGWRKWDHCDNRTEPYPALAAHGFGGLIPGCQKTGLGLL